MAKINLNKSFDEIEAPKKGGRWKRLQRTQKIDHATPCRRYLWNYYVIDDNNIIRCTKDLNKYQGPYKFVSMDAEYETVWTNKITGKIWKQPKDSSNRFVLEPWSWLNPNKLGGLNRKENWESTVYIVKGYELIFKSKKDPLYVRLKAEKQKIRKAMNRAAKKQNVKDWDATLKFYTKELESKLERAEMDELQRRKKEEQENLVKIVSHGFDPVTSFRTPRKSK